MLQPGYILSNYWPGDYWQKAYFPTLGAANISWFKIALENHAPEFSGLTLTGQSGIVQTIAGVVTSSETLDLGGSV